MPEDHARLAQTGGAADAAGPAAAGGADRRVAAPAQRARRADDNAAWGALLALVAHAGHDLGPAVPKPACRQFADRARALLRWPMRKAWRWW